MPKKSIEGGCPHRFHSDLEQSRYTEYQRELMQQWGRFLRLISSADTIRQYQPDLRSWNDIYSMTALELDTSIRTSLQFSNCSGYSGSRVTYIPTGSTSQDMYSTKCRRQSADPTIASNLRVSTPSQDYVHLSVNTDRWIANTLIQQRNLGELQQEKLRQLSIFTTSMRDIVTVLKYLFFAFSTFNGINQYSVLDGKASFMNHFGYDLDFELHSHVFEDNIITIRDLLQLTIGDMEDLDIDKMCSVLNELAFGSVDIPDFASRNDRYADIFSQTDGVDYKSLQLHHHYPFREHMSVAEIAGFYRFGVLATLRNSGRHILNPYDNLTEGLLAGLMAYMPAGRTKKWYGCPASPLIQLTIQSVIKLFPPLIPNRYEFVKEGRRIVGIKPKNVQAELNTFES